MGMLNVHVRVNDARTGKPTPVRLQIRDADGRFYPPLGDVHDYPVGRGECVGGHVYHSGERFTYSDGSCEIPLPAGVPLTIVARKGPAYHPVHETVVLGAGQLSLRFSIQPLTIPDVVQADSRCHFLTPHMAQREADAEGLDLTNLLACVQEFPSMDGHQYRLISNIEAFSGQVEALRGVYVNTFNTHPVLGCLALLNCHRAVYPLTFGGEQGDDWALADWCQQGRRKKGLAVWCDAYRGAIAGEPVIDALLGKLDAIELDAHERKTPFFPLWYRLLNAGVVLPLVGGSAKVSNRDFLGSMRTLTPGLGTSYAEWVEYVRKGRTVVTNGPFLSCTINGVAQPPVMHLGEPGVLRLRADVASVVPYERLEWLHNGDVIAQSSGATLEHELPITRSGWLAARCWGGTPSALYPGQPVVAHTSAMIVTVADQPAERSPTVLAALRRDVEAVGQWVHDAGQFYLPKRREQLLSLVAEALQRL